MNINKSVFILIVNLLIMIMVSSTIIASEIYANLNLSEEDINKLDAMRKGTIINMDQNQIVIDDMTYNLSSKTKVYRLGKGTGSLSQIKTGAYIGYENSIDFLSFVYIIDNGKNKASSLRQNQSNTGNKPKSNIRFKDGIWKN